ncbi:MAG: hypothetical protein GVY05_09545 [Bacteroidetes bacterium]|nr:hypothetical protein [Bacteroidota bacterium]
MFKSLQFGRSPDESKLCQGRALRFNSSSLHFVAPAGFPLQSLTRTLLVKSQTSQVCEACEVLKTVRP